MVAVVQGVGEIDLAVVAQRATIFKIVIEKDSTLQLLGNLGIAGSPGVANVVDVVVTLGLKRVHVHNQLQGELCMHVSSMF